MDRSLERRAPGQLLRVLGVAFGLAAMVGGMVGQGILRTPGIVAGAVYTPETVMLLWFLGGLITAVSALAYTEMACAIPCAGGPYDFVRRGFGELAGSVTGWAAWLVMVTAQSMLATVVGEFLHRLGVLEGWSTNALAVGVLAIFWVVNWTNTRLCGASQILFSAIKGAALIALVILLFSHSGPAAGPAPIEGGVIGIASLALAMRVIISTYAGWQDIAFYCEEIERPERTVVKSMFSGILAVAALYLLVNLAILHILTPAQMAKSDLPAADAASVVMGVNGEFAITLFGVLSVAAITNLKMMASARIGFALARGGMLPSALTQVAEGGTPRVALTVSVLIAAAFAATGTYMTIIATNTALSVFVVLIANAAAIGLRRREPGLQRPFRMPFYPLPALIALAINGALLGAFIFEDPVNSLAGLAVLVVVGLTYLGIDRARSGSIGLSSSG